jgi:hypothetical protein
MKELGEFSFKATSITHSAGPNDSVMLQVNCEGQAPGGAVAVTLVCTPGKSGPFTTFGTNYAGQWGRLHDKRQRDFREQRHASLANSGRYYALRWAHPLCQGRVGIRWPILEGKSI